MTQTTSSPCSNSDDASAELPSPGACQPLTHVDERGQARMVDVTYKQPTQRSATAAGFVRCAPHVVAALRDETVPKGDVLAVARIAGIAAAKKTPDLLPLAHVIGVHGCQVELAVRDDGVAIAATVRTADRTGVEMEALTSVAVAGLAVVDMVKALDKGTELTDVRIVEKSGGKSGLWRRSETPDHADAQPRGVRTDPADPTNAQPASTNEASL